MESVVFIFSLIDNCALIFLSVYFVSFSSGAAGRPGWAGLGGPRRAGPVEAPLRAGEGGRSRSRRAGGGLGVAGPGGLCWVAAVSGGRQPPGAGGG